MAHDINKVILTGNVTRDFELRKTSNGISNCAFSIAVNRPRAQDGTQNADYPNIVAWRKTAEICAQYLHKGSGVTIVGHLQTRSYDKDGHKVYVTEVVVDELKFAPRGSGASQDLTERPTSTAPESGQGGDDFTQVDDDDLPF